MSEIKVRLSLEVPGAQMLSTQDCVKMSKKEAYDHSTMTFKTPVKKGKKMVMEKEICHINTRKSKPAKQNISITKEAYDYMLEEAPLAKYNKRVKTKSSEKKDTFVSIWDTMNTDARLKAHFDLIAADLNAISYSYEILED